MKLLYQFGVILAVTFVGELLYALLPLPIPASIYGLIVMLICLGTKVVKLSQVKIAADFLIDIMPPMFIPAAVGLIVVWGDLKEILIPVVVITCLSTVIVMVCTVKVTQTLIRRKQKTGEMKDERVIK
ncbi:MAG: CidA/LrgA family protein [Coprococcus phoceensis]